MRWLYKCYLTRWWPLWGIMPGEHCVSKPWMGLSWPVCVPCPSQSSHSGGYAERASHSQQLMAASGRLKREVTEMLGEKNINKKTRSSWGLALAVIRGNIVNVSLWNQPWERKWEIHRVGADTRRHWEKKKRDVIISWHDSDQDCHTLTQLWSNILQDHEMRIIWGISHWGEEIYSSDLFHSLF